MASYKAIKKTHVTQQVKASVNSLLTEVADMRQVNIGNRSTSRNLPSVSQNRMIDIAYWLWENNPLANWIVEIAVSFVIAEEMPIRSDNVKTLDLIKRFWYDPVNRFDIHLNKHIRELFIFGELFFPAVVAPNSGILRLGYIDPKEIDEVVTDPDNVKIVIGVKRKIRSSLTDGDIFYFAINNVTNSPRGRSELWTIADWLDEYEEYLYNYVRKWSQQNFVVWDLLIKSNDDKVISENIKKFQEAVSVSGSVFGHNESVEAKPQSPNLGASEADIGARLLRNHILGSKGYPSHWYGGGEDVNKASALEMQAPAYKMLSFKQCYFKYILQSLINYQIQSFATKDKVNYSDSKYDYEIITPELAVKDLGSFGAVIKNVADGLSVAEDRQWIDKQSCMEYLTIALAYLGKGADIMKIQERLKTEGGTNGKSRSNSTGRAQVQRK